MNRIKIPANSALKTIGCNAFAESGLESFYFPSGVNEVCQGAFYNCSRLTNVHLNEDLHILGSDQDTDTSHGVFERSGLKSIVLPLHL